MADCTKCQVACSRDLDALYCPRRNRYFRRDRLHFGPCQWFVAVPEASLEAWNTPGLTQEELTQVFTTMELGTCPTHGTALVTAPNGIRYCPVCLPGMTGQAPEGSLSGDTPTRPGDE